DVDVAVAEVANEYVPAELAEAGWRHRRADRRVEQSARGEAADEVAVGIELVDKAVAHAGAVVLPVGGLLGVSDEQRAIKVLDSKGSEIAGDGVGPRSRVDERARAEMDEVRVRVENIDGAVVEVGRENKCPLSVRSQGQELVDRAIAGLVGHD